MWSMYPELVYRHVCSLQQFLVHSKGNSENCHTERKHWAPPPWGLSVTGACGHGCGLECCLANVPKWSENTRWKHIWSIWSIYYSSIYYLFLYLASLPAIYPIPSYPIPSHPIPFHPIPSHPSILSSPVLSSPLLLSYPILSIFMHFQTYIWMDVCVHAYVYRWIGR